MGDHEGGHSKAGKASMAHIYDLEDPREYFDTLWRLDYRAPENGRLFFPALLEAKKSGFGREGEATVVDLACSYGINGALLRYDVSLGDLYDRYRSEELAGLSSEELAEADVEFFGGRKKEAAPRVVGIDVAENAVRYALRAGLMDEGFVENLEENEPTDALAASVSGADLLIVTGGIGYVGAHTFDRLLRHMTADGNAPWVATFPTRMVDYEPIAELLSRHGLTTEKLPDRTFVQRRFTDAGEQAYVLEELESMGIDPSGREAAGYYHTDLYLSRPPEEAVKVPFTAITGASS